MQKKSGRYVEAATRERPKTAKKWSRDQFKITGFRAFDPITSLFGITTQYIKIAYKLCGYYAQKIQDDQLRPRFVMDQKPQKNVT